MTPFDVTDRTTWGETLTLEQVAAIYSKSVQAIKKACYRGQFFQTPKYHHPLRWLPQSFKLELVDLLMQDLRTDGAPIEVETTVRIKRSA